MVAISKSVDQYYLVLRVLNNEFYNFRELRIFISNNFTQNNMYEANLSYFSNTASNFSFVSLAAKSTPLSSTGNLR